MFKFKEGISLEIVTWKVTVTETSANCMCNFQCNMTQICNKWLQTRHKAKCWTLSSLSGEKVMLIILLYVAKQLCIPLPWKRSAISRALPVHLGLQCLTIVLGDPP